MLEDNDEEEEEDELTFPDVVTEEVVDKLYELLMVVHAVDDTVDEEVEEERLPVEVLDSVWDVRARET
jgi:hypothetical protein